jgi:hypothetical protein
VSACGPSHLSDEEIFMLDYDERMARPEKRRMREANRDRASARGRQVQTAVIAPNGRLSVVDEQVDDAAIDLLMARLDASVDGRFVPEIV